VSAFDALKNIFFMAPPKKAPPKVPQVHRPTAEEIASLGGNQPRRRFFTLDPPPDLSFLEGDIVYLSRPEPDYPPLPQSRDKKLDQIDPWPPFTFHPLGGTTDEMFDSKQIKEQLDRMMAAKLQEEMAKRMNAGVDQQRAHLEALEQLAMGNRPAKKAAASPPVKKPEPPTWDTVRNELASLRADGVDIIFEPRGGRAIPTVRFEVNGCLLFGIAFAPTAEDARDLDRFMRQVLHEAAREVAAALDDTETAVAVEDLLAKALAG
jgi:hypothetical protein